MIKNPTNFNDIENTLLRSYNRAQMALSLAHENGEEDLRAYFLQFNEEEQAKLFTMLMAIKHNPDDARRQVYANAAVE